MTYNNTTTGTTQRNGAHSSQPNGDLNNLAREGMNTAKEGAHIVMEKAQEEMKHIRENTEKYIEEATTYVRDNPTKSVLAALAAGLILGLLLKN